MQIVNDPDITEQEKRALLCSWACNACAAEATSEPRGGTLRRPPGATADSSIVHSAGGTFIAPTALAVSCLRDVDLLYANFRS
jgi:hypothetical protein